MLFKFVCVFFVLFMMPSVIMFNSEIHRFEMRSSKPINESNVQKQMAQFGLKSEYFSLGISLHIPQANTIQY